MDRKTGRETDSKTERGRQTTFTITTVILNEVDLLAIHQKDVLSQAFCSITKNILNKRMLRSFDSDGVTLNILIVSYLFLSLLFLK